jgi:membrane protease subunit HflK
VALYLASGFYFVYADRQAVVLVFGKVRERHVPPGLHWTWPFPLSAVEKLKVLETKRLTVGVEAPDQVLGRGAGEAKAQFLTGDQNIINIRLAVQYAVNDPTKYLFTARDVPSVIARTVETSLSFIVAQRKVDDLLTTGKILVQNEVQKAAQGLLDRYGCGVAISSVSIESMAPPDEVLEAFRDVASAREDRERIKREADGYANDVVPKARGEAGRLVSEAEGYCERKINEAMGDADRFHSLATEYTKARDVTAARLYLEAMEEVLPRLKKIVVEPGSIDLDLVERK